MILAGTWGSSEPEQLGRGQGGQGAWSKAKASAVEWRVLTGQQQQHHLNLLGMKTPTLPTQSYKSEALGGMGW